MLLRSVCASSAVRSTKRSTANSSRRCVVWATAYAHPNPSKRRQVMCVTDGKPHEMTTQTLRQKLFGLLSSIRVRLTLWYVVTTTAVLVLFGGLLLSTIAKMMPTLDMAVL